MATALGHCWVCGKGVRFDPSKVHRVNGHPLCAPCMKRVNELLTDAGHSPIPIVEGTYP